MAGSFLGVCFSTVRLQVRMNEIPWPPISGDRPGTIGDRFLFYCSHLYDYFSALFLVLGFLSFLFELIHFWWNSVIVFGCLSGFLHLTQCLFKLIYVKVNQRTFQRQLADLRGLLARNNDLRFDDDVLLFTKFADSSVRSLKYLESGLATLFLSCTLIFYMPYVYDCLVNWDRIHEQHTPMDSYFPFDVSEAPAFQVAVMFQFLCFMCGNMNTIFVDIFITGFLHFQVLHFRYLNYVLEKIGSEFNKADASPSTNNDANLVLRKWVKQHQDTIRFSRASRELLSMYFCIEYGYIAGHTSVPMFTILSTPTWSLNQQMAVLFFCSVGLATLYIQSSMGDSLMESNENFGERLYDQFVFFGKSHPATLHHMLLYMRRNRSVKFGFSSVFPLCSVTFLAILRMVMSYYLALKQITNKH